MRLKLQKSLIVLFLVSLFVYGCIEEPLIEPVKIPYSVIRVGNFTSNQDVLKVIIDGVEKFTLNKNTVSDYFDITSGQRRFTLQDANGNTIYNKDITIISYEEETLVFAGYYSTVDTLNTFAFNSYTDGYVLLADGPDADSSTVRVIGCVADTPTDTAKAFSVIGYTVAGGDTLFSAPSVELFDIVLEQIPTGDYKFEFASPTDTVRTDVTIGNQKKYFMFISGSPSSPQVVVDVQNPLPARSK